MKVTLLFATPGAEDILLFTKNTRLEMRPGLLEEIRSWPQEKKLQELEYMSRTVPSSWEFIDLIFVIEGVTRAFTHQLVRTRTASYAQQAMRVANMENFHYLVPDRFNYEQSQKYAQGMNSIQEAYDELIEDGAQPEDARGLLPTNILTNIVAKYNLRAFSDLVKSRSSGRVQGEYRDVLNGMIEQAKTAWPWIDPFITSKNQEALSNLTDYLQRKLEEEIVSTGQIGSKTEAWDRLKDVDLLRKGE